MKNSKRGFTLAEVLVTLAVIGVVAALTIPTIIQSSSEKQAKTSVKKALSVMNQVLAMSIAEDSVSGSSISNSAELKNLFANYMKVLAYDNVNNAFTSSDGMIYTFYADDTCNDPDDDDPADANCIIEIDINGENGSEIAANTSSYSDLYYLIVKDNTVSPANGNSDGSGNWAPSTTHFRATAGDVDNVALDALLN